MTTTATYNMLKKALIRQRAQATASPAAAKAFLVNLGLSDLVKDAGKTAEKKKSSAKKNTPAR